MRHYCDNFIHGGKALQQGRRPHMQRHSHGPWSEGVLVAVRCQVNVPHALNCCGFINEVPLGASFGSRHATGGVALFVGERPPVLPQEIPQDSIVPHLIWRRSMR